MKKAALLMAGVALAATAALAGPGPDDDALVIEGEELVTEVETPEGHPLDIIYSGWRFRSDETQALETDDFENPAMVAVEYGLELWEKPMGSENKACSDCHGDVAEAMKGIRANMPRWNASANEPWALEDWINWSITEHQGAEKWKWESAEMLAMTALIGMQSRGMPMTVQTDGPMADWVEKGKELYYTRVGQLDMACSNCHEDNYGNLHPRRPSEPGQHQRFPDLPLQVARASALCIAASRAA